MSELKDLADIVGEEDAKAILEESVLMTDEHEKAGIAYATDGEAGSDEAAEDKTEETAVEETVAEETTEEVVEEKVEEVVPEVPAEAEAATEELAPENEVKELVAPFVLDVDALWSEHIGPMVAAEVTKATDGLTAQIAQLAQVIDSMNTSTQSSMASMTEQLNRHEKTIGGARVIFSGEGNKGLRPSQQTTRDEESIEGVGPVVVDVLADNESARIHYAERRKKLFGY